MEVHDAPRALSGRDLEVLIEDRAAHYSTRGQLLVKRFGVQTLSEIVHGLRTIREIKSFPDYDMTLPPLGRQVVIDAKVCSGASFGLSDYKWDGARSKSSARQLKTMLDKSKYGAVCGFLIHFNARETPKTGKMFAAVTYLFPIHNDMDFWIKAVSQEIKSINPNDCERLGVRVVWNRMDHDSTVRPDYLLAINELIGRGDPF